jgi:hypothetical protein
MSVERARADHVLMDQVYATAQAEGPASAAPGL